MSEKPRYRVPAGRAVNDGLQNVITGLGTERDKSTAAHFSAWSLDPVELEALYRQSWAARKAVDLIADDETREWRAWQAEEAQATALYEAEKALGIRAAVNLARKWERLYGGAAIIVMQGPEDLSVPALAQPPASSLMWVRVVAKNHITANTWDEDFRSPTFGKPLTYHVAAPRMSTQLIVHRSRMVIFDGADAPALYRDSNDGFGLSVLDWLRAPIIRAEGTAANVDIMVNEASIDVVKVPDLQNHLADAESERRLIERFRLAMQAKSTVRTLILGGQEDYDRKTQAFGGLHEIMDRQHEAVAAALDMPLTRFMGRSPGGLNATGDSDLRNYFDMIRSRQMTDLSDTLRPLDEALKAHVGATGPDVVYSWNPLWTMTPGERADVAKKQAETTQIYVNAGLFPTSGLAKAARSQIVENEVYPDFETQVPEEELDGIEYEPEPAPAPSAADPARAQDAAPRTLYVSRKVVNAAEILAWARSQGFETTLPADDLHVTVAYSRAPVDWMAIGESWTGTLEITEGGPRMLDRLGPDGAATVLLFASQELQWRHRAMREAGASWDWPEYQPHITLTYQGGDVELATVEPYRGKIVLGPEIFAEVNEDWKAGVKEA